MDDRLKAQRARRFPGESYVPAAEQKRSQIPSVVIGGGSPGQVGPAGPPGPPGPPGGGGSTDSLTSTDIGVTVSSFGHAHSTSYEALSTGILRSSDVGVTLSSVGHAHSTSYATYPQILARALGA